MPDRTEWIVAGDVPARIRLSDEYVVLEDHWIPATIELSANGSANDSSDPEIYARIEVSAAGSRLRELRFISTDPDSQGIRQTDLRDVQVGALVGDLVAGFTFKIERNASGELVVDVPHVESEAYRNALRFVERARGGRTSRDITPDLLERVAKVYRDNIERYPTKAVQHHFQVSQRMAAEYVSRARKRGLLPPTKRGKKNA